MFLVFFAVFPELMVSCLNENLPSVNGRNLFRKYNNVKKKANSLPIEGKLELFSQDIVSSAAAGSC